jgi:hypothetical protein
MRCVNVVGFRVWSGGRLDDGPQKDRSLLDRLLVRSPVVDGTWSQQKHLYCSVPLDASDDDESTCCNPQTFHHTGCTELEEEEELEYIFHQVRNIMTDV